MLRRCRAARAGERGPPRRAAAPKFHNRGRGCSPRLDHLLDRTRRKSLGLNRASASWELVGEAGPFDKAMQLG